MKGKLEGPGCPHSNLHIYLILKETQDKRCNKGLNYCCQKKKRYDPVEIKS